jgi:Domain of unknown function (DUF4115)/PilZ domain
MNQRVEPRFKTDTSVTLQFANKAEQIPARIVDVSGLGFRILVEQPIAVGETFQINAEDRRLLVTVRHCGPTENGYFVGVERIDKWLPGEAPQDAAVLGRPQIKKDVDPLRVMGLRNQFSTPSAGAGKDSRRGVMLGGIAAVIGLSVLALIWGGTRGSGHTTAPAPVVETPVVKTEPETAAAKKPEEKKAVAPAPVAKAAPVAAPAIAKSKPQPQIVAHNVAPVVAPPVKPAIPVADPLQVTLHASELSWVDACADGKAIFSKAFTAGETGQIKFTNVATVRSGNAGGLEIAFGSKPAERMGQKGIIHMWKFTPAGRQEIPQNSASACSVH